MTADTFLFNAGSIFFAAWIAIIAVVTITAFGRDLLPRSLARPGAGTILRPSRRPTHPLAKAVPTVARQRQS